MPGSRNAMSSAAVPGEGSSKTNFSCTREKSRCEPQNGDQQVILTGPVCRKSVVTLRPAMRRPNTLLTIGPGAPGAAMVQQIKQLSRLEGEIRATEGRGGGR